MSIISELFDDIKIPEDEMSDLTAYLRIHEEQRDRNILVRSAILARLDVLENKSHEITADEYLQEVESLCALAGLE